MDYTYHIDNISAHCTIPHTIPSHHEAPLRREIQRVLPAKSVRIVWHNNTTTLHINWAISRVQRLPELAKSVMDKIAAYYSA